MTHFTISQKFYMSFVKRPIGFLGALVALILFTPLGSVFGLIMLDLKLYLIALVLIFIPLVVMEFSKAFGLIKLSHKN